LAGKEKKEEEGGGEKGHQAEPDRAMGFCFLNNAFIVLATHSALTALIAPIGRKKKKKGGEKKKERRENKREGDPNPAPATR